MALLAFQFQSPGPILFELGPVSVRWYGALIALAVLVGVTLAQALAKQRNVSPELVGDLAVWLVIGAIPGARLYYVLFEWERYAGKPGEIVAIWNGGIAIHGAILGGALAAAIFARLRRISWWRLADLVAPPLVLGQAIGRWGNFFNSEAFGRPTDLPWKLYIPPAKRPPQYLDEAYFHPTFLYESLWDLGVFVLLMALFVWGLRHPGRLKLGTIVLAYAMAYSAGRIWIEDLRTDSLMLAGVQAAQVASALGIGLGAVGLVWLYWCDRPLPDVVRVDRRAPRSRPKDYADT